MKLDMFTLLFTFNISSKELSDPKFTLAYIFLIGISCMSLVGTSKQTAITMYNIYITFGRELVP